MSEECVASAVAVLTGDGHQGKVYNLTGPELLSYREIAEFGSRPVDYVACS